MVAAVNAGRGDGGCGQHLDHFPRGWDPGRRNRPEIGLRNYAHYAPRRRSVWRPRPADPIGDLAPWSDNQRGRVPPPIFRPFACRDSRPSRPAVRPEAGHSRARGSIAAGRRNHVLERIKNPLRARLIAEFGEVLGDTEHVIGGVDQKRPVMGRDHFGDRNQTVGCRQFR
ncbi:hypothetical protein [Blastochloris viridis]|uniref:hypothetical protein n=1 Tax=Blastochloris viridis TaxID=1079 RepID=UPI0012E3ED58|nr:hypothetical protein [Blastochloris viridis]